MRNTFEVSDFKLSKSQIKNLLNDIFSYNIQIQIFDI